MIDPEIEWMPMDGTLLGGPFRGLAEVREFLDTLMEAWDEFRIEPEDFIERDDQVWPSCGSLPARASGIELDENWAHLWTSRGGSGRAACRCSATAGQSGRDVRPGET